MSNMDCTVGSRERNRILKAIKASTVSSQLRSNLHSISVYLDATDVYDQWKSSPNPLATDPLEVLDSILKFWVSNESNTPTVRQFHKVLEETNLNDFASRVKTEFQPINQLMSTGNSTSIRSSNQAVASAAITLQFDGMDVKHDVFPRLQPDIVNQLNDGSVNAQVILQLNALGIFDRIEIDRPLNGRFDSEQERILALMRIIQNKDPEDIRLCLETICNLRDLPKKSASFRTILENYFPGCCR